MAKIEIDLGTVTNSCFVIMPFSPTYETEYERIIRPAVEANGLVCIRGDEIYSKPQITADIWKALRSARVVIAELTGKNSNVLYEVGLAHALGKPVIIITRNENDVPFDLKALRYRYYNIDDPFWGDNLQKVLNEMLQKLINEKEYGTVFEKINPIGEMEYKKSKLVTRKKPSVNNTLYDLTGIWHGKMEVKESRVFDYNCNLHLVQIENKLSGTMIISYKLEKVLTVVQEIITGETKDISFSIYGTSYSYLQQGQSPWYSLDSFTGQISSEGNMISGVTEDKIQGYRGVFSFERANEDQKSNK